MPKLLLFPYNIHTETILKHKEQIVGYTIEAVSSFKEHKKKLEECSERYHVDCSVDYEKLFYNIDMMMLVDPATELEANEYIKVIAAANAAGKKIVSSRALENRLKKIEPDCTVEPLSNKRKMNYQYGEDKLLTIHTPIIVSAAEGEDCSKFETQLLLQEFLKNDGYKASFICSNDCGTIFGMHTIPASILFETNSFETKVIEFNHYVYDICSSERPDVIVVGIPGGLSRLNDDFTNHFSEIALIVSNAVNIDGGLINIYFDTRCSSKMIEEYKRYCRIKYAIPYGEMFFSRQRVLYDVETEKFDYYHLSDDVLSDESFKRFFDENDVTNISDRNAVFSAYQRIVAALQSNPNTI